MEAIAAGSPDSGADLAPPVVAISEDDLALIDAMQAAPRATWARIGGTLGVDATTASRRWDRLRGSGAAWLTAYVSPRVATVGFVEVRCHPRFVDAVSAAAVRLPWAFNVDETAGEYDLLISVGAVDLPTLGYWVRQGIGGLEGVRSLRWRVGITMFGEGSDWNMGAMPPVLRAELSTPRPPSRSAYGVHGLSRLAPEDQALVQALHADARMSFVALGESIGVTEHMARRRLSRLLREGDVLFRCDFAHALAGLSPMVSYRMSVPATRLAAVGSELARMKQIRLCVTVSGRHGLLVHALVHGLHGIAAFETELAERFPELDIRDRAVVIHSPKRMGWLLDRQGRAVGRVAPGPFEPTESI